MASLRELFGIIFTPRLGKMNKDVDEKDLKNGDFVDALNNRCTTTAGSTTGTREIVLGNEYAYQLSPSVLQNKKMRIYVEARSAGNYKIELFDANRVSLGISNTFVTVGVNGINTTMNDMVADMGGAFAGQTLSTTTTVTTADVEGYIEIEILTIPFWNYSVEDAGGSFTAEIITINESITQDMVGNFICIGGYDLEGEQYSRWTTRDTLPIDIPILFITDNGSGAIRLILDTSQIQTNFLVVVSGAVGAPEANGQWMVNVIDATTLDLVGSTFNTPYDGGTLQIYSIGLGEIGRAVRDENTQTWSYTRLIRSKAFNFTTMRQGKDQMEKDANKKSYYFTDDYNVPRVLYDRTITYQNDCLLFYIDPVNTYAYATLEVESRLILNTADYVFSFIDQTQTGGAIPSGNSQYATRLVTETNTFTDWKFLSNPIPATSSSELGSGYSFFGDPQGTATSKINNFQVSGNILGIFKYIELACVNRLDSGVNAFIVRREVIPGNSFTISHTGQEVNLQELDAGTLAQFTQVYTRAKNISILAGSLILSNLETRPEVDLSDYFGSITYSLNRRLISPSTGSFLNSGQLQVGEYMMSSNVHEVAGHMINERYRYAAVVEWKTGGYSRAYHIDDFTYDLTTTARKSVNFSDFDLINNSASSPLPYSYYVTFDINDGTVIENKLLRDLVERIYIMRCPNDSPQIKASGIAIPAVNGTVLDSNLGLFGLSWRIGNTSVRYGEWPLPAGYDEPNITFAPNPDYDTAFAAGSNYTYEREHASLYFPDLFMGNTAITPVANSDVIYNFGQGAFSIGRFADGSTDIGHGNYLYEDNNIPLVGVNTFDTLNISEAIFMTMGEDDGVFSISGHRYSKRLLYTQVTGGIFSTNVYYAPEGWVVETDTAGGFQNLTGVADKGFYRCQWSHAPTRSFDEQYGSLLTSKYMWTGAIFTTGESATSVDVFGGDCVTQKCWYKNRYPTSGATKTGFGQGLGFYTQNRINFQMRETLTTQQAFPGFNTTTVAGKVPVWLQNDLLETLIYNKGYNISTTSLETLQLIAAFDPDTEAINNDLPVTIAYSNNKVPESSQDSYRVFLPENRKELDYSDGEINHHAIANGELVTWQVLKTIRQYFDPTGVLQTVDGSEVIIGSGAKLKRRGATITTYGTKNGFSVCKGKSVGGNDVYYWIDTTNKALFRLQLFGDGTVNLGLVHGLDSFFEENLRFVDGVDTPAHGDGITAIWNERNKEAIFTVRGKKVVAPWAPSDYIQGAQVSYTPTTFSTFERTGEIYICLVSGNGDNPEAGTLLDPPTWKLVPHRWDEVFTANGVTYRGGDFYNEYTVVFNEYTNGFDTFYSFMPKIYLPYKNTYTSPIPIDVDANNNQGFMYEHNRGDYALWYMIQGVDGYYQFVINAMPDDIKVYYATRFRTTTVPARVDVVGSMGQETFMTSADFTFREMNYDAAVRNNILTSSNGQTPTEDTGKIYGDSARVKLTFTKQIYQKLDAAIVRIRTRARRNQT